MSIQKFVMLSVVALQLMTGTGALASEPVSDAAWRATYDARQRYFEKEIGKTPKDILKMLNMTGVWPGGGLYVIPASRLGQGLSVYTTFGLSNPDMPTSVQMAQYQSGGDGARTTQATATLRKKTPAPKRAGAAGYGYEIMVLAAEGQQWPLGFLQWAVNAEIGKDAGLLSHVEKHAGLTVERIDVGTAAPINVLIAKAAKPLPGGVTLPAGKMELLVATVITDDEMRWSRQHGREALLEKLQAAGIGQVSKPGRASVVE